MKNHTFPSLSRFAATLLAAALLTISAPASAQTPAQAPAQAAPVTPQAGANNTLRDQINATGRRGFLIEASRNNRKLFVYGGTAASRTEYFPLNPPLIQSLAQSTALLVDVNPGNPKALAQAAEESGNLPPGTSLEKSVPPETWAHLQAVVSSLKGNPASYQRLKPWLAALALRQQFASASGYDAGQATLLYIVGYAQGSRIPIVEMEGAQAQLRLLGGMSADAQRQFLDQTLKSISSGQERQKLHLLVDEGWARGNHVPVNQANAMESSGGAAHAAYAAFHSRVWLAARSQRMADAIERAMETTNVPMVALPAFSVIGQGGLLSELVKRGFVLKDVQQ